jgi:hypothetical protein
VWEGGPYGPPRVGLAEHDIAGEGVPSLRTKIAWIAPAGAESNYPFRRRLYATSRHFDSSCCVSPFLCFFNYPRMQAVTSAGENER